MYYRPIFRVVLSALLLLPAGFAGAQTGRTYFDADWQVTGPHSEAAYYRMPPVKKGKHYQVKVYYMSGTLQMEGYYRDTGLTVRHGRFIYYDPSGNKDQIGKYADNEKDSIWTTFDGKGRVRVVAGYSKGKLHGARTTNYSDGRIKRKEKFDQGIRTEGKSFGRKGEEIAFSESILFIDEEPAFPQSISHYLGGEVRYPETARERNIEGRAIIGFVISETGAITDVRTVRSSGNGELDEEAQRAIRLMPAWTPGKDYGKPVKVSYTIPITFKLD